MVPAPVTGSRLGLVVSTAFAAALALTNHSVVDLWHDIGSVITPALLLPVAAALMGWSAVSAGWTLASMIAAFGVSLAFVLTKNLGHSGVYPWSIEPIYPGLVASLLVFAAGWSFKRTGARAMKGITVPFAIVTAAIMGLAPHARAASGPEAASPATSMSASAASIPRSPARTTG